MIRPPRRTPSHRTWPRAPPARKGRMQLCCQSAGKRAAEGPVTFWTLFCLSVCNCFFYIRCVGGSVTAGVSAVQPVTGAGTPDQGCMLTVPACSAGCVAEASSEATLLSVTLILPEKNTTQKLITQGLRFSATA